MELNILRLCTIMCVSALFSQVHSSAIPMWELLRKDEKRSFLYSLFANQVEEFCENSKDNCSQELLKYGLRKLKEMTEEDLDHLDPYQRQATNIVWETMLDGHDMMKTTPKPHTITTTSKPNSYDDQSFATDLDVQSEASAKVESLRVLPPVDFVYKMDSSVPQYVYPNQIQYIEKRRPGTIRARFDSQDRTETQSSQYSDVPLTGPLVVRVYPDGRPVDVPYQPHDEDLRQYQLSKVKVPNL